MLRENLIDQRRAPLYFLTRSRLPEADGAALLSPEIKRNVEQDLAQAASFLNKAGIRWFLAGGTALDLAGGGITRDHTDVDVAILQEDLPQFFRYATKAGYRFEETVPFEAFDAYNDSLGGATFRRSDQKLKRFIVDITFAQQLEASYSPFAFPVTNEVPFMDAIDIDAIRRNTSGDVPWRQSIIPFQLYENTRTYKAINGEEVPSQPLVATILHKLETGRRKDLIDIQRARPTLHDDEQELLERLLVEQSIVFRLTNGEIIPDLQQLLQRGQVGNITEEIRQQQERLKHKDDSYAEIADILFPLVELNSNTAGLLASVCVKYGPLILKRFGNEITQLGELVYSDQLDRTEFDSLLTRVFSSEELLRKRATYDVLEQQLWNITLLE